MNIKKEFMIFSSLFLCMYIGAWMQIVWPVCIVYLVYGSELPWMVLNHWFGINVCIALFAFVSTLGQTIQYAILKR